MAILPPLNNQQRSLPALPEPPPSPLPAIPPEKLIEELRKRIATRLSNPHPPKKDGEGERQESGYLPNEISEEECFDRVMNDPSAWSGGRLGSATSILPR